MNIVQIAQGSRDFDILVQALSTASLVTTIENATDLTVFAPTDAAFTQLALDLGYTGDETNETAVFNHIAGALADLNGGDAIPLLSDVFSYHTAAGVLSVEDMKGAATITIGLSGALITPNGPVLGDLEPDLIHPALTGPAITADDGIIHAIDRVLLPTDVPGNDAPSLVEIATAGGTVPDKDQTDTDILVAALGLAGLVDTVASAPALTVLAPTDAAFVSLAQPLGLAGSDEAGALQAIVDTLTGLGGGDPIPLLTSVLTYHILPDAQQPANLVHQGTVTTLQGGTFAVLGSMLVDNEPALADPMLVATDIQASNGIVHLIDEVLIPIDIPTSNGLNAVQVLIGTDARDRLQGGDDNDLIIDGTSGDLLIGGGGADVFQLAGDGTRNKIIDFENGIDTVDVSAWGATGFGDLSVAQLGSISLLVGDGQNSVVLQAASGTIAVSDLLADSFVFASSDGVTTITGTDGRDRLEGTDGADILASLNTSARCTPPRAV